MKKISSIKDKHQRNFTLHEPLRTSATLTSYLQSSIQKLRASQASPALDFSKPQLLKQRSRIESSKQVKKLKLN